MRSRLVLEMAQQCAKQRLPQAADFIERWGPDWAVGQEAGALHRSELICRDWRDAAEG